MGDYNLIPVHIKGKNSHAKKLEIMHQAQIRNLSVSSLMMLAYEHFINGQKGKRYAK